MPSSPSRRRVWLSGSLAAATFITVTVIGLLIVGSSSWSATEVQVVVWVHGVQSVVGDVLALTINSVFGPGGAVLVVLIALAWILLATRSWRATLRTSIVLGVPWACAEVLKAIVQRPRPNPELLQPMIVADPVTFSYPRGHTAFAAALCCALLLVVLPRRMWRWGVPVAVLVVLVTAWSRVYLGVHYPTDVLASAVLVPALALATARATAAWSFLTPPPADAAVVKPVS